MTQDSLDGKKQSTSDEWTSVMGDDDAEVVKLKVDESIKGLLVDKFRSRKYNSGIYKIKEKEDTVTKVLLGTTILDKKMAGIDINTEVKILRKEDIPSDKGNPIQDYDVFVKNA